MHRKLIHFELNQNTREINTHENIMKSTRILTYWRACADFSTSATADWSVFPTSRVSISAYRCLFVSKFSAILLHTEARSANEVCLNDWKHFQLLSITVSTSRRGTNSKLFRICPVVGLVLTNGMLGAMDDEKRICRFITWRERVDCFTVANIGCFFCWRNGRVGQRVHCRRWNRKKYEQSTSFDVSVQLQ